MHGSERQFGSLASALELDYCSDMADSSVAESSAGERIQQGEVQGEEAVAAITDGVSTLLGAVSCSVRSGGLFESEGACSAGWRVWRERCWKRLGEPCSQTGRGATQLQPESDLTLSGRMRRPL